MDSFGIFSSICIAVEIIALNILFSKKIKNKNIKVNKLSLLYFIISLASFLFIYVIVNLSYEFIKNYLLNNLIQSVAFNRLIIMNLILILLPLLQISISQIFINFIIKQNKLNEVTLIGQNEE
jgi:hypothetical protein